jgi:sRNA-binding protein
MDAYELRVGQTVRVTWLHRSATVLEVDRESARVALAGLGGDEVHWVRIEDLAPVIPPASRRMSKANHEQRS